MVARTRGWLKPVRDRPDEQLPPIAEEMQRHQEAEQSNIKKQLKHAQQQIDLTKSYPGRE
jgi:hypothetical protein